MEVLYEASGFAVVNKPVGVPTEGGQDSLVTLATARFGRQVYPIHRLDTGVSGALLLGLNKETAAALSAAMAGREIQKEYWAVVSGTPEASDFTMKDLLFKDSGRNKTFVVDRPRKGVKEAVTECHVLQCKTLGDGPAALLSLWPKTGRSHQLRVQLSHRKMPIFGDGKYGSRQKIGLALFCRGLTLKHPETGEKITVLCPTPAGAPFTEFTVKEQENELG